jgi:hypothetical protein
MPCRRIINLTNNHDHSQHSNDGVNDDIFIIASPGLPYNTHNMNRDLCIKLSIVRMQVRDL